MIATEPAKKDYMVRIETAAQALREGRFVILCDDPERENEGDVVCAAEHCTPELVNFMKTSARGLICVPMLPERLDELELPLMAEVNTSAHGTAFTVSVDAVLGTTTGISAADMSETIMKLADPAARPTDFRRPGHVFPLRYAPGGVLKRVGQTEGSIDLLRYAGLKPTAVVCEICNEDGSMARQDDLHEHSSRYGLPIVHVSDLVRYRLSHDTLVSRVDTARLPTSFGEFTIYGYGVPVTGEHHVALVKGDICQEDAVLVRVHSECLTGDAFHSRRCDCGDQLDYALRKIGEEGVGVVLYLRQEGRGIGLLNKIRAYHLQDGGMDTVEANQALGLPIDNREYGIGAQILRDLGVRKMRLLTNNPAKLVGLTAYGLSIVEHIPIPLHEVYHAQSMSYLQTKVDKMGHMINMSDVPDSAGKQAEAEPSGSVTTSS